VRASKSEYVVLPNKLIFINSNKENGLNIRARVYFTQLFRQTLTVLFFSFKLLHPPSQ
jgi:hypothetical protein